MRKLAVCMMLAFSVLSVYAGDVANFMNLGFSPDGTRFAFGQYGVADVVYQSWAEIFCVDVVKNKFVPDGTFIVNPGTATSATDPRGVFASLQNKSAAFLAASKVDSALRGRTVYIQSEDEPSLKTIAFRDFETKSLYSVELKTFVEGSGKEVRSSFYLLVSITGADGKEIRKTVGLPGFKRDGVQDYLIRNIITDNSGRSLVFVIEKKVYDRNGSSIRFMVETLRL